MLKGFCDTMNVFKGSLCRLQTLQQSSTSINCSTRARITRARTFPRQIFQKGLNFKEIELLLSKVYCEKNFKNLKLIGRVVVYFSFISPNISPLCACHTERSFSRVSFKDCAVSSKRHLNGENSKPGPGYKIKVGLQH